MDNFYNHNIWTHVCDDMEFKEKVYFMFACVWTK